MRITKTFLAGLVVVVGMNSPQTARAAVLQTSAATVDDKTLETRINTRLDGDKSLAGYRIDVDLDEGVVTLGGTVKTDAQRAEAQRLATVTGVKSVRNEIVVDPTATPKTAAAISSEKADRAAAKTKAGTNRALDATKKGTNVAIDKTKEGLEKAADATKKAAGKVVGGASAAKDGGKDVGSKVGEAFTDGALTTKVKGKIADDTGLKGSDIRVETNDHVVTLKGTAGSTVAKARAEEIARTTDGVKDVINQVVVSVR
jgi:hyperosmotically inducible protein